MEGCSAIPVWLWRRWWDCVGEAKGGVGVETQLPWFSLLPSQVLETCVKNCGHRFHILVANRDFIDSVLVKIISPKNNPPTIVQDKVLALIQVGELPLSSLLRPSEVGPLSRGSSCFPIIRRKEWRPSWV